MPRDQLQKSHPLRDFFLCRVHENVSEHPLKARSAPHLLVHILRMLDAELKGTEEYKACKNDPKKALSVVYHVKVGQIPKGISDTGVTILQAKVEAVFSSLPRLRELSVETFYRHKLPLLKISAEERAKIKQKEVRSCAVLSGSFLREAEIEG